MATVHAFLALDSEAPFPFPVSRSLSISAATSRADYVYVANFFGDSVLRYDSSGSMSVFASGLLSGVHAVAYVMRTKTSRLRRVPRMGLDLKV